MIKDIRGIRGGKFTPYDYLKGQWPGAPEGVNASRSSGVISAMAVARATWAHLKTTCWPDVLPSEDAITTYSWTIFQNSGPGYEDALNELWNKARDSATSQPGGKVDDSFAGVCRGPGFVRAFWANPIFQLTTPHLKVGPDYLQGQVVLDGEDLSRQGTVAWNGLEPPTLAAAVDNITREEHDDQGNTTYIFFQNPALIQVELKPELGSTHSLADISHFTATKRAIEPVRSGIGKGTYEKTGQQTYTIMAAVLHRESDDDVDSVRLLRRGGKKKLHSTQPKHAQWPFTVDEAIPVGCKLSVFYMSLPQDKTPLSIKSSRGHAPAPTDSAAGVNTSLERTLPQPTSGREEPTSLDTRAANMREIVREIQAASTTEHSTSPSRGRSADAPPLGPQLEPLTTNELRTRSKSSGPRSDLPLMLREHVPAQTLPRHARDDNEPPAIMQPATARPAGRFPIPGPPPTEPRAERGVKRGMNQDYETAHKRPKLPNGVTFARHAIAASSPAAEYAQGASDSGRLPAESNRGARDVQPAFQFPAGQVSSPDPFFRSPQVEAAAEGRGRGRGRKRSSGRGGRR